MEYSELAVKLKNRIIETERLIIRPYSEKDEDGLLELFHDEQTMYMDGDRPILEKNAEFRRRIDLIRNGPLIWFFAVEKRPLISSDMSCFRMRRMLSRWALR